MCVGPRGLEAEKGTAGVSVGVEAEIQPDCTCQASGTGQGYLCPQEETPFSNSREESILHQPRLHISTQTRKRQVKYIRASISMKLLSKHLYLCVCASTGPCTNIQVTLVLRASKAQ